MKFTRYYSPDPPEGGGVSGSEQGQQGSDRQAVLDPPVVVADAIKEVEQGATKDDDKPIEPAISIEKTDLDALSKFFGEDNEKEQKEVSAKKAAKAAKAAPAKKEEVKPVEGKKPEEKVPPTKAADIKKEDQEEPLAFKLEDKTPEDLKDIESWGELGKSLDLDVKGDDETAFRAAFEEKVNQARIEAQAAAAETTVEKHLESVNPEARLFYEYTKNGGKTEDWVKPFAPFERLQAMDNETLVRENLTLQKMTDENVDKEIVKLIDGNTLDNTAKVIRDYIATEKTKLQQKITEQQKTFFDKSFQAENKRIQTAIEKKATFMDIALTPELKQKLSARITSFRKEIMDNNDLVADLLLYKELGAQGKDIVRKQGYNEARSKYQDKLHNIENLPKGEEGTLSRSDSNEGKTLAEMFTEGFAKAGKKEN